MTTVPRHQFDASTAVETAIINIEGAGHALDAIGEGGARDYENALCYLARQIEAHCRELRDLLWPKDEARVAKIADVLSEPPTPPNRKRGTRGHGQ